MYRDRFRKWGLLKNFKAKDTHAIVSAIKSRQGTKGARAAAAAAPAAGTTEVLIRGRRVDFRWRIRRSRLAADAAAASPSIPSDVEILSPLTRRPAELDGTYAGLRVLREYMDCQGGFDAWQVGSTVTWAQHYDLAIAPRVHDFFCGWYHGSALLLTGRDAPERARGSRMLNISFTTLKYLLGRQTPCFLLRYARCLSEVSMSLPNAEGLCRMMARYAKDICAVTYGPHHPFTKVIEVLNGNVLGIDGKGKREDGKRDLENASLLTHAYVDLVRESRSASAMVMNVFFDRFWNLLAGNRPTEQEIDSFIVELEAMLEGVESLCRRHRPKDDWKNEEDEGDEHGDDEACETERLFAIAAIKRTMAELLGHSSEQSKRQRGADLVGGMLGAPARPGEPFWHRQWLILVSAVAEAQAGRLDGAEARLREALRSAVGALGYGTAPHLAALFGLKRYLEATGRWEEAGGLEEDCETVLRLRERAHGLEPLGG
jgi:hypothetical protein